MYRNRAGAQARTRARAYSLETLAHRLLVNSYLSINKRCRQQQHLVAEGLMVDVHNTHASCKFDLQASTSGLTKRSFFFSIRIFDAINANARSLAAYGRRHVGVICLALFIHSRAWLNTQRAIVSELRCLSQYHNPLGKNTHNKPLCGPCSLNHSVRTSVMSIMCHIRVTWKIYIFDAGSHYFVHNHSALIPNPRHFLVSHALRC